MAFVINFLYLKVRFYNFANAFDIILKEAYNPRPNDVIEFFKWRCATLSFAFPNDGF